MCKSDKTRSRKRIYTRRSDELAWSFCRLEPPPPPHRAKIVKRLTFLSLSRERDNWSPSEPLSTLILITGRIEFADIIERLSFQFKLPYSHLTTSSGEGCRHLFSVEPTKKHFQLIYIPSCRTPVPSWQKWMD